MKTDDLRKLIKTQLDSLKIQGAKEVFYKTASDTAGYPHIVFNLSQIGTLGNDLHRSDYVLEIDVWDKNKSESVTFNLCDTIEELLSAVNLPQASILPTFFFESRQSILDEDKDIKHELIKFTVQMYQR